MWETWSLGWRPPNRIELGVFPNSIVLKKIIKKSLKLEGPEFLGTVNLVKDKKLFFYKYSECMFYFIYVPINNIVTNIIVF